MGGKIEDGGAVPRIDVVERLAAVLRVSPCFLAYGIKREGTASAADSGQVGVRLKEARERAGLARSVLGQKSGISGQSVANIEDRGYKPGIDTAEQLAKALGVSPCWLAFGEPEERRSTAEAEIPEPTVPGEGREPQPGAGLTAKDLEPLVNRLSPEERERLGRYALGQAPEDRASGASQTGTARKDRRSRSESRQPSRR